MARGLLKFGFFMYHGSKLRQKIHALSRWRSYPHIAQLFCSRRTIMAHALLNFGCFANRSPHDGARRLPPHGSKNVAKIHAVNADRESLAQRTASRPSFLLD